MCSFSSNTKCASTALHELGLESKKDHFTLKQAISYRATWCPYLTITLKAPKGVTSIAGANAYAAKLATSPTITRRKKHINKELV